MKLREILFELKHGVCTLTQTQQAILALIPNVEEQLSDPPLHDYEDGEIAGWNAFRAELLKNLGVEE